MQNTIPEPDNLAVYRVRAKNTSADSENKIHDDEVASLYGFRGGLVPGVTIYGYMTVPLVKRFGRDWLTSGSIQVRFHKPFYEGDGVIVKGEIERASDTTRIALRAERQDGETCATAIATTGNRSVSSVDICIKNYISIPLPSMEDRPLATAEAFIPGEPIGTLIERFFPDPEFLTQMDERLPIYTGDYAVAHPAFLLGLMNQALLRNFKLGPWIHASSDLTNHDLVRDGEVISVRGRINECFERKGHEFVVLDFLVLSGEDRVVQQVRHTAIYRPKFV